MYWAQHSMRFMTCARSVRSPVGQFFRKRLLPGEQERFPVPHPEPPDDVRRRTGQNRGTKLDDFFTGAGGDIDGARGTGGEQRRGRLIGCHTHLLIEETFPCPSIRTARAGGP